MVNRKFASQEQKKKKENSGLKTVDLTEYDFLWEDLGSVRKNSNT